MSGILNDESAPSVRAKINAVIAREFETLADLAADTLLTYSGGQANSVQAGDTIRVRRGDHTFLVLPAIPSTFAWQTAGSIKLDVLPTDDGVYRFDSMLPTKDGTGDNLAKINYLLSKTVVVSVGARLGPEIVIGQGTYAFSDTINLKCICNIFFKRATCIFPAATAGIILNRHNTFGATVDSSDPYGADGSEIDGFQMVGGRGDAFDETKSGIWLRARGFITNCSFNSLAGHGVYAGAGSDGNPYMGNCNLSRVKNITTVNCRGSSCHTQGTDANAGSYSEINGVNNDQWCVYEGSFLGNEHHGHHSYGNLLGSYFGSNQSPFTACYSEDGVGNAANTAGPLIACTISSPNAGTGPKFVCEHANGPRSWTNENGGFRGRSSVHSADLGTEGNMIITSRHSLEGIGYPFRFGWADDATVVFFRWASATLRLLIFNGRNSTATYGRASPVGESTNIPDLFLGNGNNGRRITFTSGVPTSGEVARGEVFLLNAPSSGGVGQAHCTTGGIAGSTAVFRNAANLASS